MKRLLLPLCCAFAATLFADTWFDPESGIEWTYTLSNGEVALGGGSSSTTAIPTTYAKPLVIPDTLNGLPVRKINNYAFYNCVALPSVSLPEGVTSIGSDAFSGCTALTSVELPERLTSLGSFVFSGCNSLTAIALPEGITSIPSYAFIGCSSLSSLSLPKGVTTIEGYAFYNCGALTSVALPESRSSLGDDAFYNYRSLSAIELPNGLATIGAYAFWGCSSVKRLSIPASVTAMPWNAFPGFDNLETLQVAEGSPLYKAEGNLLYNRDQSVLYRAAAKGVSGRVVVPESVLFLFDSAFANCSALTEVLLPPKLTALPNGLFSGCTALASVNIPEGVTSIGDSAFRGCSSLTRITFPEGVTSIGNSAFWSCSSLREVTFLGDVPSGWTSVYASRDRRIAFPQAYAAKWNAALSEAQRGTLVEILPKAQVAVSATMTGPKTMSVTYTVKSPQPTVKVRAVAWKDGVRSFANIVPVRTAAAGSPEAVPNGGEVASGEAHTFVWQVSANWQTDLDKVAVEILVEEGALLPQECITIPTLDDRPAMTITRNRLTAWQLFDALVWCYAEGDAALEVVDGVVRIDGKVVVDGSTVKTSDGYSGYGAARVEYSVSTLLNYLYGKMGFKVLAGEELTYAKAATRLDLGSSGIDQVAVKLEKSSAEE